MKRGQLLNRHLSYLIASLGHLQEITIADAGLPVPAGVDVIDLAVSPGVPSFFDVLKALRSELVVEEAIYAKEVSPALESQFVSEFDAWQSMQGKQINSLKTISHDAFKSRTSNSSVIIRTGETTPHCNIILVAGVNF